MTNLEKCIDKKILFGVCCGLSKSLNIDVSIIRLGFIFGTFLSGSLLLWAYIVMAIILPKNNGN